MISLQLTWILNKRVEVRSGRCNEAGRFRAQIEMQGRGVQELQ